MPTARIADPVLEVVPLGTPWPTADPFLLCVHHLDHYPTGDERLAPAAPLAGRNLGQDFAGRDGWRMYHGRTVPGFPAHPHRGFETVTYVRQGYVDHADSTGAAARFGRGDVQWMTAGAGVVHAEMFPLLDRSGPNPLELFQIWLNLPRVAKLVEPHFAIFWEADLPRVPVDEGTGEVTVIAGALGDAAPPDPPPHSWAADPEHEVAIWHARLDRGATWTLPRARHVGTVRHVYVFAGTSVRLGEHEVAVGNGARVRTDVPVAAVTEGGVEVLVLQGRPIGEPVVQLGPFVMNDRVGIERAVAEYRRAGFGGWPWPHDGPTHGPEVRRFARHADGRVQEPSSPGGESSIR